MRGSGRRNRNLFPSSPRARWFKSKTLKRPQRTMCMTAGSDFTRSGHRWRPSSPTKAGNSEMKLFLIQCRNRRSTKWRPTSLCFITDSTSEGFWENLRTHKKGRKACDLQPFRGRCAVTPEAKLGRSALNQKLNHYGVWMERWRSAGLHFLFEMFNLKKNPWFPKWIRK